MKHLCLIFKVHIPLVLHRCHFFDIGDHPAILDEQTAVNRLDDLAKTCFLPANHLLSRQINSQKGKIRVAFSMSGITAELMEKHAWETFASFRNLAASGSVEFLSGTYSGSFSSLWDPRVFRRQAIDHGHIMERLTGTKSSGVFMNTGLIYNDDIGQTLDGLGVHGVITEGDRQLLGWKSPNRLYSSSRFPAQKLFFRNPLFSDQLVHHFQPETRQEPPADPRKFLSELLSLAGDDHLINLVIPYDVFRKQEYGKDFFHFIDHFLYLAANAPELRLSMPSEILRLPEDDKTLQISRTIATEEGTGFGPEEEENELRKEALSKLYELSGKIAETNNSELLKDWNYLQASDHFLCMGTAPGQTESDDMQNPYGSPYEAFINFMNILNDFKIKLDHLC